MFSRLLSRIRHEQAQANEQFMVCPHCRQWGKFGHCGVCSSDAVRLLIDNQIKRMPVVDRAGQVAGLVSRRALLNGMLREPEPPPTI